MANINLDKNSRNEDNIEKEKPQRLDLGQYDVFADEDNTLDDLIVIEEIRNGKHDHSFDDEFIIKQCHQMGLVVEPFFSRGLVSRGLKVTSLGKEFCRAYERLSANKDDYGRVYSREGALMMRHTYIFLNDGLDCPCCETPFEEIEGSHIDK